MFFFITGIECYTPVDPEIATQFDNYLFIDRIDLIDTIYIGY